MLKRAVIGSGKIANLDDSRVQFISEAEASATFALAQPDVNVTLEEGDVFIVCDAGGGTTDIVRRRAA